LALSFVRVEDHTLVLLTDVWSLTVFLCEVMDLKEIFDEQFFVDLLGIEDDLDSLVMSRQACTHLFVGWILPFATHVSDPSVEHAFQLFEEMFNSPETTTRKEHPVDGWFLTFWDKNERNGIDAVANVLFGESFTVEDVAQVCPTVGAKDLGSNFVLVELLFDRARYLIVEGGPATTRMEFVRRVVQRYSAISAHVDALFEMICVFARERRFCSLFEQDEPFKLVQIGIDDLSHVHHTFLSIYYYIMHTASR